jgi:uncharacterized protein YndB with AHSA1/START domain
MRRTGRLQPFSDKMGGMSEQATTTQLESDSGRVVLTADFPYLSPQALFDYFTVPDLLARWWPPEATADSRPGGSYQMRWPAMGWELYGAYSHFEPGRRLAFSWNWRHEPELPTRQVDIQIEPLAQGSRLTLIHSTYSHSPADQTDRQSHIDGWHHFLRQLQKQEPLL